MKLSAVVAALLALAALAAALVGASSASARTAAKQLKIGLVADTSGLKDKSFNQLVDQGMQQFAKQTGAKYTARESQTATDYVPNLQYFAEQGYDYVVANGYTMEKALDQVAGQFPKTHFAIIDDSYKYSGSHPNVLGLLFREQQAGYLAGYLAGLAETTKGFARTNSKNVVSSVGGMKQPPVDRYIAGFQAGVKASDPKAKVLNGYSGSFDAADKCRSVANAQINQGSDIVFQVAGGCGLGALGAAKDHGYWGIGVDADQSSLGSYILASAIKRVDTAVIAGAKAVQAGTFKGGRDQTFDAKVNGVGIALTKNVKPAWKTKLNAILAKIKAGTIKIPTTVGK